MASYRLIDCEGVLADVKIEWSGAQPLDAEKSYVFDFETICWTAVSIPDELGLPDYNDGNITEYADCDDCNNVCYRSTQPSRAGGLPWDD